MFDLPQKCCETAVQIRALEVLGWVSSEGRQQWMYHHHYCLKPLPELITIFLIIWHVLWQSAHVLCNESDHRSVVVLLLCKFVQVRTWPSFRTSNRIPSSSITSLQSSVSSFIMLSLWCCSARSKAHDIHSIANWKILPVSHLQPPHTSVICCRGYDMPVVLATRLQPSLFPSTFIAKFNFLSIFHSSSDSEPKPEVKGNVTFFSSGCWLWKSRDRIKLQAKNK